MQATMDRLRALLTFGPPASRAELAQLAEGLDCQLPPDVVALYQDHNGEQRKKGAEKSGPTVRLEYRLMSVDEALETHAAMGEGYGATRRGVRLFWTNDNSDYVGVYVAGMLRGAVCYLDHESFDETLTPTFRNVSNFLAKELALAESDDRGSQSIVDPTLQDAGLAAGLRWHFTELAHASEADREAVATHLIHVTPTEEFAQLRPLLQDPCDAIVQRAAQHLGSAGDQGAIDVLVARARAAGDEAFSWLQPLGRIGSPAARAGLISILNAPEWRTLGADRRVYFLSSLAGYLKRCGCRTHKIDKRWFAYQAPESTSWTWFEPPELTAAQIRGEADAAVAHQNWSLAADLYDLLGAEATPADRQRREEALAGGARGPDPDAERREKEAAAQLSAFANVRWNDAGHVEGVSFDSDKGPVTDETIAPLRFLPQLDRVFLKETLITDGGLACLANARCLRMLTLTQTNITDAGLAHLAQLERLPYLYLSGTRITDAGFAALARLGRLLGLELSDTAVRGVGLAHLPAGTPLVSLEAESSAFDDAGLAAMARFHTLRFLKLSGSRVTGAGLVHLAGLTQLKVLELSGAEPTGLGDADLAPLTGLAQLEHLVLGPCRLASAGVAPLARLVQLRALDLGGSNLDDRGLAALKKLPNLWDLTVTGTQITDAGIESLVAMPALQILQLDGSQVTERGKQRLRAARPKLDLR